MTSSSSAAGGPYGLREIRGLYPSVTENHLRYLEKWGLIQHDAQPRDRRVYSFAALQTIKHVSFQVARRTPLRVILRSLAAERQGQLVLDFHATPDTPRAKVVTLHTPKPRPPDIGPGAPLPVGSAASMTFPFSDPQTALAAKYFIEGSRLDDG